jgi:hypothetical protein
MLKYFSKLVGDWRVGTFIGPKELAHVLSVLLFMQQQFFV